MISLHYIVLLGVLLWASLHDLVKHRVPDYVFLVGGGVLLIASLFSLGFSSLFGMGKALILMMIVGITLNIFFTFGIADVFALMLIGMAFPENPIRITLAIVFFVMYIWMKFWSIVTRSKKVPAIPGILLGTIGLIVYLM